MKDNEITKRPNMDIFDRQFSFRLVDAPICDPTKFTILTGDDGILDDLFSYQVYNHIKNHWRAAAAPADIQDGMIWSQTVTHKLYHEAGGDDEEILQLTRSFDVKPQFAALRLMDTDDSHFLSIECNEDLTGNKLLNLITGDATRTITFSGSPTLDNWFDQSVKQASSPIFVTVKLSGLTDGYFPYHVADATGLADSPIYTDGAMILINETTNTEMTQGLTIQQAGYDDEILAFKSSDVAHGVTNYAETDTYGLFTKAHATDGGVELRGLSGDERAINLVAYYTNDDTGRDVNANAAIQFNIYKKAGAGRGNTGVDANMLAIKAYRGGNSETVWILDKDGDTWQDGLATAEGFIFGTPTELTIAGGAITVTKGYHTVDTQGNDATDDLETINGGIDGMILILQAEDTAHTVVLKPVAGVEKIRLEGGVDFSLATIGAKIILIYDANQQRWFEISRSAQAD